MLFSRWLPVVVVLLCADAVAHERLTVPDWCEGGQIRILGSFEFSAQDLAAYAACVRTGSCVDVTVTATPNALGRGGADSGSCSIRSCGEFDDDYGVAARLADRHCAAFAFRPNPRRHRDEGSVIPMISSPAQFNLAEHHGDYAFEQGLSGMCAVCVMPRGPIDNQ